MTKDLAFMADEFRRSRERDHVPQSRRVPDFIDNERWIADRSRTIPAAACCQDSPGVPPSLPGQPGADALAHLSNGGMRQ